MTRYLAVGLILAIALGACSPGNEAENSSSSESSAEEAISFTDNIVTVYKPPT